ncbi:hypothetical protein Trydic_g15358 [Trypoxylus dichotomus]
MFLLSNDYRIVVRRSWNSISYYDKERIFFTTTTTTTTAVAAAALFTSSKIRKLATMTDQGGAWFGR